jgi:hypothetical protein
VVCDPVLKLIGDAGEIGSGDAGTIAVGIEEPQDSFRLLKGLDQPVQQQPIKAAVPELDATLVMLEKGVHGTSSVVRYLEVNSVNASSKSPQKSLCSGISRAKPLAS